MIWAILLVIALAACGSRSAKVLIRVIARAIFIVAVIFAVVATGSIVFQVAVG